MRCGGKDCPDPVVTRGYCEYHYRKRLSVGMYGYRDGTAAREHIGKLRELGWTWVGIGEAAGISFSTPYGLWSGRYRRLQADMEKALLSIPIGPMHSHHGVNSCGTRRRVQALAWMGWPMRIVAERAGIPASSLRTLILPTRSISRDYVNRVRKVYEQLETLQGPSYMAKAKAHALGFAPPAAWDDDTIDNPDATPDYGGQDSEVDEALVDRIVAGKVNGDTGNRVHVPLQDRIEAVRRMLRHGVAPSTMANRIGTSKEIVDRLIAQVQPKAEEEAA